MKSTGIVRRIDDLGRIVIPKEIRRTFRIEEGDPLEISTDGKYICFSKYVPVDMSAESTFARQLYDCCKVLYGNFGVELRDIDKSIICGHIHQNELRREVPISIDGDHIGYLFVSINAPNEDSKVNKIASILY